MQSICSLANVDKWSFSAAPSITSIFQPFEKDYLNTEEV